MFFPYAKVVFQNVFEYFVTDSVKGCTLVKCDHICAFIIYHIN